MKKVYFIFILLFVLLIAGCSNDGKNEVLYGNLYGQVNLSSIPLGNTKIMINDTIAVTDSNGRFQVAKDDNKEVQLLSMNIDDDFIIISKEGFNDYKTYNWKNGTNVYLRPYLSVVRLWDEYSHYTYQHAFTFLLADDYDPADNKDDYLLARHESDFEYNLVYDIKTWGEKSFQNSDWRTLNELKTGKWILEGKIAGQDVYKSFTVEAFDPELKCEPEITDYHIKDKSIIIEYNIPFDAERAYVVVERYPDFSSRFYRIIDINKGQVEVPFADVEVIKRTDDYYNWYIQTVNINGMNYGFEIRSKPVSIYIK